MQKPGVNMENRLSVRYLVELVITVLLILFITIVLVRMFVHSRNETVYAANLTEAVQISENMAELSAGLQDRQAFIDTVSGLDNVTSVTEEDGQIVAEVKGAEGKPGRSDYEVRISWAEEYGAHGRFVLNYIDVFCDEDEEAIYRLDTGKYNQYEG